MDEIDEILAIGPNGPSVGVEEDEFDLSEAGLDAAAADMLAAFEAKDAVALKLALRSAFDILSSESDDMDDLEVDELDVEV